MQRAAFCHQNENIPLMPMKNNNMLQLKSVIDMLSILVLKPTLWS